MPIQPTEPDADFRMMTDPEEWPHWPFLPIKRTRNDGQMETAVLCCPSTVSNTTYVLLGRNLFDARLRDAVLRPEDVANAARIRQLIDDGWMVD